MTRRRDVNATPQRSPQGEGTEGGHHAGSLDRPVGHLRPGAFPDLGRPAVLARRCRVSSGLAVI